MNNGGATDLVRTQGDNLAAMLGPEFDIVGFDPHGAGATTPLALCFDSDLQFAVWDLQDVRSLNTSDDSIPFARAHERVVGERCWRALGGNKNEDVNATAEEWGPGRFMDTASAATDMLRISEKIGQDKVQYFGSVRVISFHIYIHSFIPGQSFGSILLQPSTQTKLAAWRWTQYMMPSTTVLHCGTAIYMRLMQL